MTFLKPLFFACAALLGLTGAAFAQSEGEVAVTGSNPGFDPADFPYTPAPPSQPKMRPEFCIMPPGPFESDTRCLRDFLLYPEQWKELRGKINSFGSGPHKLMEAFNDNELRQLAKLLKENNIRLTLEVNAVKEWATLGKECFDRQHNKGKYPWKRLTDAGFEIDTFSFDEPLANVREISHKSDQFGARETANFIAEVRKHYPKAKIIDIEAYPCTKAKDIFPFLDAVQANCKAMGVRPMEGFRLDADHTHPIVGQAFDWKDIKEIEDGCRARGLMFSLVYWFSSIGYHDQMGTGGDSSWYTGVMSMGYDYAKVGTPDEYCIESWVGRPLIGTPESGSYLPAQPGEPEQPNWSFARCCLDFYNKFVAHAQTAQATQTAHLAPLKN